MSRSVRVCFATEHFAGYPYLIGAVDWCFGFGFEPYMRNHPRNPSRPFNSKPMMKTLKTCTVFLPWVRLNRSSMYFTPHTQKPSSSPEKLWLSARSSGCGPCGVPMARPQRAPGISAGFAGGACGVAAGVFDAGAPEAIPRRLATNATKSACNEW